MAKPDGDTLAVLLGQSINDEHTARSAVLLLRAEVDRLKTWDGLMSTLDKFYPVDVLSGVIGDEGPRIITLIRELNRLRQRERELARENRDLCRHIQSKDVRLKQARELLKESSNFLHWSDITEFLEG